MKYAELLDDAVKKSRFSLAEIAMKCKNFGVTIDRTYISKLCTANKPPASDKVNTALAKVLGSVTDLTYESLRLAAYKEKLEAYKQKFPDDVLEALGEQEIVEGFTMKPRMVKATVTMSPHPHSASSKKIYCSAYR